MRFSRIFWYDILFFRKIIYSLTQGKENDKNRGVFVVFPLFHFKDIVQKLSNKTIWVPGQGNGSLGL